MWKDAKKAGTDTLERRRYLQNIALTFKRIKGIDKVNSEALFQLAGKEGGNKGNSRQPEQPDKACQTELWRNSYAYTVE
jgi:hypothetical protein